MRVAKTSVPSHVLGAFLLVATAGQVVAQQKPPAKPPTPAPAPAQPTMAPGMQAKLYEEAQVAFEKQDYATVTAKLQELIKGLGNTPNPALEMLHFQLGVAHLLGGNAVDAEKAFDDAAKKFPKGEYTSRYYLGIGKAAIQQGGDEKQKVAIEALKKAAADPKLRTEAGLALGQVYM